MYATTDLTSKFSILIALLHLIGVTRCKTFPRIQRFLIDLKLGMRGKCHLILPGSLSLEDAPPIKTTERSPTPQNAEKLSMITQAAAKALHISAYCPKPCDFHILCPGLTFGHDPQAPKDGG